MKLAACEFTRVNCITVVSVPSPMVSVAVLPVMLKE